MVTVTPDRLTAFGRRIRLAAAVCLLLTGAVWVSPAAALTPRNTLIQNTVTFNGANADPGSCTPVVSDTYVTSWAAISASGATTVAGFAGDTVWIAMQMTNRAGLPDTLALSVNSLLGLGTTIWDSEGLTPVSETQPYAALGDTVLWVGVALPADSGGVSDSLTLTVTSVTYGADDSLTVSIFILTNQAPIANAGSDTIVGLAEIVLDGTGSADPDGDTISYAWSQVSGDSVVIINSSSSVATCTDIHPGTYVFLLTITDSWGAAGAVDTVAVTVVDSTLPGISATAVVINGDTTYTTSETVTLAITASDTLAVEMMIANDSAFSGGVWVAFSGTKQWGLGAGDGIREVQVKFRNGLGLESGSDSATIILDSVSPTGVALVIVEGLTTTIQSVTLKIYVDGETATAQYRVSEFADFTGATWSPLTTGDSMLFTVSAGAETKAIRLQVRDEAGNITADTAQIGLQFALYPASGFTAVSLAGGMVRFTWTASPSFTATWYRIYSDSGTGTINYAAPWATLDTTAVSFECAADSLVIDTTYVFQLVTANNAGDTDLNSNVKATVTTVTDTCPFYAIIVIPRTGKRVAGNNLQVKAELYGDTTAQVWVTLEYRAAGDTAWLLIPANNQNHPNPDGDEPYFTHWHINAFANGDYELRAVAWNNADTDGNPAIITITHDDQNPDIFESLNEEGDQEKKEKMAEGEAVESEIVDASGIYTVDIPPGNLDRSTALNLLIVHDTPAALLGVPRGQAGFETGGYVMELSLDNGQSNFDTGVIVRIPFTDRNGDGIIDGTRVRLTLVQVLYYSDSDAQWHALPRSAVQVDYADSVIVCWTGHFSKFSPGKEYLGGDLGVDGSDAVPDGDVDGSDLAVFNGTFGSTAGSGSYNENADIVTTGASEGRVDAEDLFEVGRTYGTQ